VKANEELAKVETERYYECCGKSFVEGVSTPVLSQEILGSVHFEILTDLTKQMKKQLNN
jgi:hypothetical protein